MGQSDNGDFRSGLNELRSYLSDIVDEVIKKIRPYIVSGGYDPAKVGDFHKDFNWVSYLQKHNITIRLSKN